MGRSIPASGHTQSWYSNILAMDMNNSPFALESYYRLMETGMAEKAIAIYIFQDRGRGILEFSNFFRTLSYNVSRNVKENIDCLLIDKFLISIGKFLLLFY